MSEALVCSTADVELGAVQPFDVQDSEGKTLNLAIVHSRSDKWFAMTDRCSHGRFKLSEGWVEDEGIECTRHGSIFDFESGAPLNPPASEPVKTYPVRIDGESVYVTV